MRRRAREIGTPTVFGPKLMEHITLKVKTLIETEARLFCPFTTGRGEIIRGSVDPEVLDTLTQAKRYKVQQYSDADVGYVKLNEHCMFQVDFDAYAHALVPDATFISMSPELRRELEDWWNVFYPIYQKWMVVRHVAEWFNINGGTPAAVRYYWPSMIAMCAGTESTKVLEMQNAGIGTHLKEPKNVHTILPLARETATWVGAGQMLPQQDDSTPVNVTMLVPKHNFCHINHVGGTHTISSVETRINF